MNFGKASLHVILAAALGLVFIGGIAYISALITKNTLPEEEAQKSRDGYKIFSPQGGTAPSGQKDVKVAYAKEEWTTYGGDYYNRRYSELDQVDLATIHNLKPVWVTSLGIGVGEDGLGEVAPLVVDDVMYIATGSGTVKALDAETGEEIWGYQPKSNERLDAECCGKNTSSVAVGEGRVYVGNPDTTLAALDQKTGEIVWEKEVADWGQGYRMTSAPLYYNGKIYTAIAEGSDGTDGYIVALDAENGRNLWEFHDIPAAGGQQEEGSEVPEYAKPGNMTAVWNTPAVDPELEIIYFAAGYRTQGHENEQGQGSLTTNIIVAVNVESGEYEWHFEDESTEVEQASSINPVVLFDMQHEGEVKKVLGQAGKKGWMYLLDRKDGSPLQMADEAAAFQVNGAEPASSLPFEEEDKRELSNDGKKLVGRNGEAVFKGREHSVFNPFGESTVKESSVSTAGNWQPSAYSPKTEYYYVMAGNEDVGTTGMQRKRTIDRESMDNEPDDSSHYGNLTAVDMNTRQIAWQVDWRSTGYAGILATAGDVVFAGGDDGQVSALHAATGQEVWSYRTGADINTPAVTYKIGDDQYMSVVAVEKALAGDVYSQRIYTFKLDGGWDGMEDDATDEDGE